MNKTHSIPWFQIDAEVFPMVCLLLGAVWLEGMCSARCQCCVFKTTTVVELWGATWVCCSALKKEGGEGKGEAEGGEGG